MKHKKSDYQQAFVDGEINGKKWEQERIIEYCKEQIIELRKTFEDFGYVTGAAAVDESQYQDVIDFIRGDK